ncbi:MAG: GNAT family N-acetyltransferase [Ginsengibacter sp.]
MLFETERLYVAKWEEGDLDSLYGLFNDTAIKEFILPKLTMEETECIFEKQLHAYENNYPFGRYFIVEKISNDFIGLLLLRKNKEEGGVEIGYSLIREHWKKGYATEIVQEGVNWLFEQKKISNIYAVTETGNLNSQNVLLKCGFCREENLMEEEPMEINFTLLRD